MQVLLAPLGDRHVLQALAAVLASFVIVFLVLCWPKFPVPFIIKFGVSRISMLLKELAVEGGRSILPSILGARVHRLGMVGLSRLHIRPPFRQLDAILGLHLVKHILARSLIHPESVLLVIIRELAFIFITLTALLQHRFSINEYDLLLLASLLVNPLSQIALFDP